MRVPWLAGVVAGAVAADPLIPAYAAEPNGPALSIGCPVLGEGPRAALEARARAELAAGPTGDHTQVSIQCDMSHALVEWRRHDSESLRRTVSLGQDPTATVDALLDGIHALMADAVIAERPPSPSPAPGPATWPQSEVPSRFALVAGTDGELWQGAIGAALGGHAGARLSVDRRWSVVAMAGPAWGIGSSGGLRAFRLRGALRVDFEVAGHLQLGFGGSALGLWTTLDGPSAPSQAQGASVGLETSVRYALPVGPITLGAGPAMQALFWPLAVDVAGSEQFRIPTWVFGVSLDAATR